MVRHTNRSRWGGIMGLLDGLLGGVVGAEMATVVNSLIQQHGGIQGMVSQLEQQGLGGVARSWIGSGPNQSISPEQLQQAFGGVIGQLAAKTGLSQQELTQKLAQLLPAAIDKLTPGGNVPAKSG
jgi:uncharacterized protein YidB (DUF937 family)